MPLPKQGLRARFQEQSSTSEFVLSIRHKVLGAAVVIPVLTAAPAIADDVVVTPEPVTSPTPDPTPTDQAPVVSPPQTEIAASATTVQSIPVAPAPKRVSASLRTSRAGASIRTVGTRYSPVTAVFRLTQWARQGRAGYHNGCLRLTDNAYGASNRVGTALRQWFRAKRAGFGHTNRMAPVGAQLFWRTSNPAGHVATYVGRGLVVTNMPSGRVKMVSWRSVDRWGPYLGWAEPYYG